MCLKKAVYLQGSDIFLVQKFKRSKTIGIKHFQKLNIFRGVNIFNTLIFEFGRVVIIIFNLFGKVHYKIALIHFKPENQGRM